MVLQTKTATAKCNGSDGSNYTLTLTVTENSIDTANNRSSVTVKLTRTRASSSHYNHGYNNPTTITINGSSWATATPVSAHNTQATQTLIEHTDNITHGNDGSFTINVTGSFTSSSSTLSGGSVSLSMTLTPISRVTQCPSFEGYASTQYSARSSRIVISPLNTSNTHDLYYVLNGVETLIHSFASQETEYWWVVPNSFVNYIGSASSMTLPLKLYTKSNGTTIGYTTNNATIYKPITINSVSMVDTNPTTIALTNDENKLIMFKSNIQTTVDYTLPVDTSLRELFAIYNPPLPSGEYLILDIVETGNVLTFSTPPDRAFLPTTREYGIGDFEIIARDTDFTAEHYVVSVQNNPNIVMYSPIFIDLPNTVVSLSRPTVLAQTMFMNFSFEWWNSQFPNGTNNTITIKWRVKRTQDDETKWSAWQTVNSSSYNTYNLSKYTSAFPNRATSMTGTITFDSGTGEEISRNYTPIAIENPLDIDNDGNADITWDYLTNYDFEIEATDILDSTSIITSIHSSVPIYDAFQTSNGDKYFNINGNLIFNNDTSTNVKENIDTLNQNVTSLSGDISDIKSNNILWQDYAFMNANQVAYLSDTVLHQTNGIVLIFSAYSGGQPRNWNYGIQFVPKAFVTIHEGAGIQCTMGGSEKGVDNTKYLYIYNNRIEGNDANNNDGYVLREVIGV